MANDRAALQRRNISTTSEGERKLLESTVREGLLYLCSLYDRDPNPAWPGIWCDALKDIPAKIVEPAFREVGKTFVPTAACPFPTPAHLRNIVATANQNSFALKAEEAWQVLLDWTMLNFHPDIGITRGAPQLDAVTWHAAKAAGGLGRIYSCPRSELVWCKKAFIEYFTTVHETGKVEHLLSDDESKKLLDRIRNHEPQQNLLREGLEDVSAGRTTPIEQVRAGVHTCCWVPGIECHTQHKACCLCGREKPQPPRRGYKPASEQIAELKQKGYLQ